MKRADIAVVVPVYKATPDKNELLSLVNLKKYLGKYKIYFIAPENLNIKKYDLKGRKIIRFPKNNFANVQSYSKLLLERRFYEKFSSYKYILIYQLDALVFSDKLLYWCKKNYDYIGAPNLNSKIGFLSHNKTRQNLLENGGLSLRKIESFMEVIDIVSNNNSNINLTPKLQFVLSVLTLRSHSKWITSNPSTYPFNEDGFWSFEASKYLREFRIAPFREALKFSFEKQPEKSFGINNNKLPFGVHAWNKYNKSFWEKILS